MARWLPWFRENKADTPSPKRVEVKTLGLDDSSGAFMIFGYSGATTPGAALDLYDRSTAVSVPINMISDSFSVLELAVKKGNRVTKNHPVLNLLRRPSPFHTQELFLEAISKFFLITGELPVVAVGRTNRPPLQLYPLSPQSMTPVQEAGSDAAAAWTVSGNTLTGEYRADSLVGPTLHYLHESGLRELHVARNFSTRSNSLLRGQSLLVSAAKEARAHILGTSHNVSLLEKGGRVSLVFHFEEDMDPDTFEAVKEKIREQYGGDSQAGQIGVTSGGKMTVQELGVNPKDMDFASLQKLSVMSVAMQYRVPIPLVTESRQTLNNFQEAKLALYDDAVIPLARRVLGSLSDFLLPRYGEDPSTTRIVFDPESVTALVMRRNTELVKRKQLGVETPNELRAYLGREGIEGGNEVYQAANMIPIGSDLYTEDNDPAIAEPVLGGTGDTRPDRTIPTAEPEPTERTEEPAEEGEDDD